MKPSGTLVNSMVGCLDEASVGRADESVNTPAFATVAVSAVCVGMGIQHNNEAALGEA